MHRLGAVEFPEVGCIVKAKPGKDNLESPGDRLVVVEGSRTEFAENSRLDGLELGPCLLSGPPGLPEGLEGGLEQRWGIGKVHLLGHPVPVVRGSVGDRQAGHLVC
jgi:hypothetical protein